MKRARSLSVFVFFGVLKNSDDMKRGTSRQTSILEKWAKRATAVYNKPLGGPKAPPVDRADTEVVVILTDDDEDEEPTTTYGTKNIRPLGPDTSLLTVFESGVWRKKGRGGVSPGPLAASPVERNWLLAADRVRARIAKTARAPDRCFDLFEDPLRRGVVPVVNCRGLDVGQGTKRVASDRGVLSLAVDSAEEQLVPFFLGNGFAFVRSMNPADYAFVVDDQVALLVERKTDTDLAGGIEPGRSPADPQAPEISRFADQRSRLGRLEDLHRSRVMYLREADRGSCGSSGLKLRDKKKKPGSWPPASLEGAMVNAEIRDSMRVRHSDGIAHTVFLLYRYVLSFLEKGCDYITGQRAGGTLPREVPRRDAYSLAPARMKTETREYVGGAPRNNVNAGNFLEASLRAVPGVGQGMAIALRRHFRSWGGLVRTLSRHGFDAEACRKEIRELKWSKDTPDALRARNGVQPAKTRKVGPAVAGRIVDLLALKPPNKNNKRPAPAEAKEGKKSGKRAKRPKLHLEPRVC
jgi:hypothetical protein